MPSANQNDLQEIRAFLGSPTPAAWVAAALRNLPLLLVDHANCEKKAAATALALLHRYTEHPPLLLALSALAREELRHFEQVVQIMTERDISYRPLTPAPYAEQPNRLAAAKEPARLADRLLVAAVIEARSCERFACLVPALQEADEPVLADFYATLLRSEARHYRTYLALARDVAAEPDHIPARLAQILARDRALISQPDPAVRFHSGPPADHEPRP